MYKISLAHFYSKLLSDNGNVVTLKKRCEWHNIELNISEFDINDKINAKDFDMFFLGDGQELQQKLIANELQYNKNQLQEVAEQNAVFLAIGCSYQLLGEYYQTVDGEKIDGINLLDAYTINNDKRFTGNVTAKTDFLAPQTLVGFENHSGLTYLKNETKPLAIVEIGNGNNGKDKTEGARKRNVFGTYLHGPILPKNYHFADYLISLALEKKYNEKIELTTIDDSIEEHAHKVLIGKTY